MSENETNFLQKNSPIIIVGALIAACLIIYTQTLWFDFINIDDRAYIYENRALLSGFNWESVKWTFTAFYSGNWHPVTWLSHFLDFALFGLNAGGHHATNVLFHTLNAVLTFIVFRKITGDVWKSAIVAFLFAVHPTHVESVAWIAERRDVLSTFFWLLTMLFYFRYAKSKVQSPKSKVPNYILIILFFALGLMSKAMLVTLPFVLLLCDFWALERFKRLSDLKPLIIEKLPLFALTIVASVITFLAQKSGGAVEQVSLSERLANAVTAYAKYVVMLFYPVNLGLWYPFEPNKNPLEIIGSAILLLIVSAFCWRERKRRKYLLMGWLWFLGTLVPVIGLVQIGMQNLADRYTYIPYFGLFVMAVWGAGDLLEHFKIDKKIAFAICVISILILSVLAFRQTSLWKSSETLYENSLRVTEKNYFIITNLCLHHFIKSAPQIAEPKCTELLAQTPPSAESNYVLGVLRMQTGKFDQSIQNFEAAIRLRPDWGILYTGLANTLSRAGKPDEAEKNLQKAFSIRDASLNNDILARSANDVGTSFLIQKHNEKAIEYFTKALELKPDLPEAQDNLKKAKGEK